MEKLSSEDKLLEEAFVEVLLASHGTPLAASATDQSSEVRESNDTASSNPLSEVHSSGKDGISAINRGASSGSETSNKCTAEKAKLSVLSSSGATAVKSSAALNNNNIINNNVTDSSKQTLNEKSQVSNC